MADSLLKFVFFNLFFQASCLAQGNDTLIRGDCLASLKDRICISDSALLETSKASIEASRKCTDLPNAQYVNAIEKAYRVLPTPVNQAFCGFKRILIDPSLYSNASVLSLFDRNEQKPFEKGWVIILHPRLLNQSMDDAFTLKERLNFKFVNEKLLPKYVMKSGLPADILPFVFAHETAHLINYVIDVKWPYKKPDFELCYYFCGGLLLDLDQAVLLYKKWEQSDFISPYGSYSMGEDLADTFAFYVLEDQIELSLKFLAPGINPVDINERLSDSRFDIKKRRIRRMLSVFEDMSK